MQQRNYRGSEPVKLHLYVLHSRPYRDTSAIVTGFSSELGKVTFVAKGVRTVKTSKIALLQPFTPLHASLFGRNQLKNLGAIEALGVALPLRDKHLYSAMYLNELLVRLLPVELVQLELFIRYERTLTALAQNPAIEPLLRDFELCLLQELGYGIQFSAEQTTGAAIQEHDYYAFDPQQGLIKVAGKSDCAIIGSTLRDIQLRSWSAQSLAAAKRITRAALQALLGHRPLKSRELFTQKWIPD